MIYPRPHPAEFAIDAPPSEIKPFPDWARGLGIAFDETNGYPEMTGFNGLFQAITQYIKYLEQNGFAEWSADVEYPAGAGVRVGNVWYRAKVQNTNKNPANSQNEWELFLNAAALSYTDPIYIDENNTVKIRSASTTQSGTTRFATSTEVANKTNVSAALKPSDIPSMFGGVKSANGWERLPSGLILQWGTVDYGSRPAETNVTVNFTTAFPTACLNISLTRKVIPTTLQNDGSALLVSQTRTNFIVNLAHFSDSNQGLRGFTWFAVGY